MAYNPQRDIDFDLDQQVSELTYKYLNFRAKYTLSLFLSVLDNLLDLGINLQEYKFTNLNKCTKYNQLNANVSWNEDIITSFKNPYFIRCDGLKITQTELFDYIDFSDLEGFLDKIVNLTEVEYYSNFIEDANTINPKKILPIEILSDLDDMAYFSKQFLMDIKILCREMQKKLKKVAQETEIMLLNRKITALENRIKEVAEQDSNDSNLYASLVSEIEKLYEELMKLPSNGKKQMKEQLDQRLVNTDWKLKKEVDNSKKIEYSDNSVSQDEEIRKRLDVLEARMESTEKIINDMKNQFLEYLENGGNNPLKNLTGLSKEEQLKIVSEFKPKTTGAKLRKKITLGILKLGLVGGIVAGSIALHDNLESNISMTPLGINQELQMPVSEPVIVKEIRVLQQPIIIKTTEQTSEDNLVEEPVMPGTYNKRLTEEETAKIVIEVIRGNWATGKTRRELLTAAGYDYDYIQSWVNDVLKEETDITVDNLKQLIKK